MGIKSGDNVVRKNCSCPLECYRKLASFEPEKMLLAIDKPYKAGVKRKVWEWLERNKLFHPVSSPLTSEQEKILTARQLVAYINSGLFDNVTSMAYNDKTRYLMIVHEATEQLNSSLAIKFALGVSLFSNVIMNLGTERHLQFYNDVWSGKILSCLAITEVGHGSDTKRFKTTATYDHQASQFIINTPDIEAAKCWVGNLGMQCTHALLFAQLVIGDVCHGLHMFIVPIRDPSTKIPYPGLVVGDLGHKTGLHGIDNGYIIFNNYRIPKENLLNRSGDVNEDGEYETSFSDPQRILGAALESLSAGRIGVMMECANGLTKSVVVAVRYSVQRSQFADSAGIELPIIEYQTHQWRVFPYIAVTYGVKIYLRTFFEQYLDCVMKSHEGFEDVAIGTLTVTGVHALVSCSKAYMSWVCRDAIQEAREACGGHAYHKCSGIGDLRNNHDPKVTFEGDNTVLLQQTSNWVIRRYLSAPHEDYTGFPMTTVSFLADLRSHLAFKFCPSTDVLSHTFVSETYCWLLCWLSKTTVDKTNQLKLKGIQPLHVRSHTQVYRARVLALAFAEHNILNYFWETCCSVEEQLRPVLTRLYYLFALWSIYKHIPLLYQGGYCCEGSLVDSVSEGILSLCSQLKPDALALVDSISPPDFILNSVLGNSHGKLYENLFKSFQSPSETPKPSTWNSLIGTSSKL